MRYYRKYKPGGRWAEIKGTDMLAVINAHFDETPSKSWDGSTKPSRQQVADHIHSGKILSLYTADYKAVEDKSNA
jgi:hypothetical protein